MKDVAERPATKRAMDEVFGAGNWTALPCLWHTQACGEKRRIYNAKTQLENAETRYVERSRLASVLVSPITDLPARCCAARGNESYEGASTGGIQRRPNPAEGWCSVCWRVWPSQGLYHCKCGAAYLCRYCMYDHVVKCRVGLYSIRGQRAATDRSSYLSVFMLPAACRVPASTGRGSGQELFHTFFDELRSGLKADKWHWLATQSVSLGIAHALHTIPSELVVEFWPQAGIIDEIPAPMDRFRSMRQCPTGDAVKFWGLPGFAVQAQYGQRGRTAMRPWAQCQATDVAPWHLTRTMERSMDFIETLLEVRPRRRVKFVRMPSLCRRCQRHTQVAPGSLPGGGVLPTTRTQRASRPARSPPPSVRCRSRISTLCEAAMIPIALLTWPRVFVGDL